MKTDVSLSINEIASITGGERFGDLSDKTICEIVPLDEPSTSGISFVRDFSKSAIPNSPIGALFIAKSVNTDLLPSNISFIRVEDPYRSLVSLIPTFFRFTKLSRSISDKSDIHPSVKLGSNVSIGAFVSIGEGVELGDNVTIYPHVTIYSNVKIAANCIIHSNAVIREECTLGAFCVVQNGAVIGSDGFGYVPDPKTGLSPIPQVGTVELSDYVDVGANSCVDRATLGKTRVGMFSKIDNLVQVGHNTQIGKASILCGQVGIAGSTKIGNEVVLAGAVGVADHLTITDKVRVTARSAVKTDLPKSGDYSGNPAIPAMLERRNAVIFRKLAETIKDLKKGSGK